jgi:hypothetical protein
LTTLYSYGEVGIRRQGEIIRGLAASPHAMGISEFAKALVRELRNTGTEMPVNGAE